MWRILYTKQALKDKRTAVSSGFGEKVRELLAILKSNPYAPYPPYEKLVGDLRRILSRRINFQHRIVYIVYDKEHIVKIISMWGHYE